MKNLYLRTSVALACAFGLAACGGGSNNLQLGGTITGLTKDMTISNNGGTPMKVLAGSSTFVFTDLIGTDSNFEIKVVDQPTNANCAVYNGKGKTGAYSPTGILIQCIAHPHNVTATVTGLKYDGLDVVNGSLSYDIDLATLTAKLGSNVKDQFSFTRDTLTADGVTKVGQVGEDNAYGFVILNQPPNQTCTILDGAGIMGNGDVAIKINCL